MNKTHVRNAFILVIGASFISGFGSIFFIDSLVILGFLPLFMLLTLFSFGPRYLFFFPPSMKSNDIPLMQDRINSYIERYALGNIIRTFREEFRFNMVSGVFIGVAFIISLFDPRQEESRMAGALRDNFLVAVGLTFLTVVFLGVIIHLLCWLTTIILRYHLRHETRHGDPWMNEIIAITMPSYGDYTKFEEQVVGVINRGIATRDMEHVLIPQLIMQCTRSNDAQLIQNIAKLRILAEHGYWKAIFRRETLVIIENAYASDNLDVRNEGDFLLSCLINHETIDEVLQAGFLERTIENIIRCEDFCDNGLFRFCVFGQAERVILHVISLLDNDDPVIRRKALILLAELAYVNEEIADELHHLENERKEIERKIELDVKKLFFDPPAFARPIMPIDEIKQREEHFRPLELHSIIEAILEVCKSEKSDAVREKAYHALMQIGFQHEYFETIRESNHRNLIVESCVRALADKNILIRKYAIRTLGHLGDRNLIPTLNALLDDPSIIPPPTPLTPEEEKYLKESGKKEEQLSQRTIGEVAKDALAGLQRKVKTEAMKKKSGKKQE